MDKMNIKLQNCYGIKNLEYEFDFKKRKNYIIYASNGMMKTSFTKTFKALSNGKKPSDEVFGKKSSCDICVDDNDISREEIFVINSYEDEYISPNSAKLMVHKSLKEKYDATVTNITTVREAFFEAVKKVLQDDTLDVSNVLASFLECNPIDITSQLYSEFYNKKIDEKLFQLDFSKIKYNDIFNIDVAKFVSDTKNLEQIKEYEERYNELLEKSPIFKRGVFSHNNADYISESLSENGFFNAEHKLVLHGINKEINTANDLEETLLNEKNKIFSDEKLKKKFDKINSSLGKRALIKFRSAIELQQEIIPELSNFEAFKRKVWTYIFKATETELHILLDEYKKCEDTIETIKKQALTERTIWDKVLDVFKARFSAPFTIEVPNKTDVAFGDKLPEFIFKYVDPDNQDEIEIQRKELEKVLSQGEKRALFLLNIIDELEAIKISGKPCLIIADDIAESFDYKNKYAIIEYLQEMMRCPNLHFIILTHNFDFYRTVAIRSKELVFPQMVQRKNSGLEIVEPEYVFKNPFEKIKKGMVGNDDKAIITSIPFIRNLIEYTSGESSDDFIKLTSLLHIKNDTSKITLKELEEIFNRELKMDSPLAFSNNRENEIVYKLIMNLAKTISQENREGIDLTGKIVISMAIRLLAEKYMIEQLTNQGETGIDEISKNQTGVLLSKYKEKFSTQETQINTLNKVVLMSSENIHINSFMFEPLIDMSIKSLISLYGEVCILSQKE